MTIPALILGIVLSTLLGAFFHLWRGGSGGRLVLYMILAWAGFWGGHVAADLLGWNFGKLGPLHLAPAILVCLLFLFAGNWLSQVQIQPK
ncbi:MAG: hypothetical protein MUC85_00175 [Anaerolineales bacterium]|nr:hypothetical protein [Anaerolineales bacterium]